MGTAEFSGKLVYFIGLISDIKVCSKSVVEMTRPERIAQTEKVCQARHNLKSKLKKILIRD